MKRSRRRAPPSLGAVTSALSLSADQIPNRAASAVRPYLSASILAGKIGGLPLIFGLTAAAGIFEGVLSRLLQYLRVLFPPEVTGLVVSMVGIELVGLGCPRFLGYAGGQIDKRATLIACLTLAAMIGPTVWGKGRLRLYPIVLGLATGYTASPSGEAACGPFCRRGRSGG